MPLEHLKRYSEGKDYLPDLRQVQRAVSELQAERDRLLALVTTTMEIISSPDVDTDMLIRTVTPEDLVEELSWLVAMSPRRPS